MNPKSSHLAQTLQSLCRRWEEQRHGAGIAQQEGKSYRPLTVALSREAGAGGTEVARELGRRLQWPVYDHEILEAIARETGIHASLLESVDEKKVGWIRESINAFLAVPHISESTYLKGMIEMILALGNHGACIIVGRGSPQILPEATTLRVRIVAPREQRIEATARRLSLPQPQAAQQMESLDRERNTFVQRNFSKDPADPRQYDLVLNTAHFSVGDCVEILLEALKRRQANLS